MGNKRSIKRKKYNKKAKNIKGRIIYKNKRVGGGPRTLRVTSRGLNDTPQGLKDTSHRSLFDDGMLSTNGFGDMGGHGDGAESGGAESGGTDAKDTPKPCCGCCYDSEEEEEVSLPTANSSLVEGNISSVPLVEGERCLTDTLNLINSSNASTEINFDDFGQLLKSSFRKSFKNFENDSEAKNSLLYMILKAGAEVANKSASIDDDTQVINDSVTNANTSVPFVGSKTSGAQTNSPNPWMNIIIIVLMSGMVLEGVPSITGMVKYVENKLQERERDAAAAAARRPRQQGFGRRAAQRIQELILRQIREAHGRLRRRLRMGGPADR